MIPLTDAAQSHRYKGGCCSSNPCTAARAIDGDTTSNCNFAHTLIGGAWWSAEMTKVAKIEKILVYPNEQHFNAGNFRNFTVETRLNKQDAWKVCKGEYSMKEPYNPHGVECDQDTVAKYIRLSCKVSLILREVSVLGKPMEGK